MSESSKVLDAAKAIQELAKRGVKSPVCPFCKGTKFTVTQEVAAILVSTRIGGMDLSTHIPSAMLICNNCGNIQFFALARLGMLNGKGKDEK